jgi:hypothetical protein
MSLLTSRSPKDISLRVIPAGQNGPEPLREMKLRGFDERQRPHEPTLKIKELVSAEGIEPSTY